MAYHTLIKEKSCGAIIYRVNKTIEILIIKQKAGHYGFPKGHVEKNESELETALREIKEETNLDVTIDTNFRITSTYSPYPGSTKDVIYFVATPITQFVKIQESEVSEAFWCNYQEALQIITHEDNRNILRKALEYIYKENKNLIK